MLTIEEILKSNEGKTLEFKESLQSLQGIIKTIVAFANTAGGTIVIGVEDKTKKIVGVDNPLAEEERLASAINDSIAPLLMPDIETRLIRKKELMLITVPHVSGPYYLKSVGQEKGTYVRLGSTNRVVDTDTLIALKNFARNIYFDEQPHVQGNVADLDWDAMKDLFHRHHKDITPHNARGMGLTTTYGTKVVPSFGGMILFGINRTKLFPEAIIRCARFLGFDKGASILDQATIESYLPLALEEALKFIQRNTRLGAEIKGLVRKDIPEYPLVALREIITNAIVHADYAIKGVFISIAIFDDRVEITNPGGLPFGFTMERALAGSSRIRNRVIAKVFYHLKWIEQWGSGLRRIVNECQKQGLNEPLFEEVNNQFRVTLYAKKIHKAVQFAWQKELVAYLKKKKKISTKVAANLWDVTPRTARSRLLKLIDVGIVQKVGTSLSDPLGNYVLVGDVA